MFYHVVSLEGGPTGVFGESVTSSGRVTPDKSVTVRLMKVLPLASLMKVFGVFLVTGRSGSRGTLGFVNWHPPVNVKHEGRKCIQRLLV